MYLVHIRQPAYLLTPNALRCSTLSAGAKRVGIKEKYKNPLYPDNYRDVERVTERSNGRVSLRSRIQYASMK